MPSACDAQFGAKQVDVGSVDGFSFSNTYFFERELDWKGICVEPNSNTFETLRRVRSKSLSVNTCLDSLGGRNASFMQNTGHTRMLSGLVDYMSNEHKARIQSEMQIYGGTSTIVNIPVRTLTELLEQNRMGHVDLLSIDTEGAELEVLKGLDFDKFKVDVIILEMLDPTGEEAQAIVEFLTHRGYVKEGYVCQDQVFRHKEFTPQAENPRTCVRADENA
mmetsp:Transcript_7141/g.11256  ORF Transcript_7141/g.11256 Transcript_7141/m.11256 type:complete len:220 (+) Transcript_7141:674-1333(+)